MRLLGEERSGLRPSPEDERLLDLRSSEEGGEGFSFSDMFYFENWGWGDADGPAARGLNVRRTQNPAANRNDRIEL